MTFTILTPPAPEHSCDLRLAPRGAEFIKCTVCEQVWQLKFYSDPRPGESTYLWNKIPTPEWAK